MKLQVQIMDMEAGRFVVLCDEAGRPLPNQISAVLETRVDEVGRVRVEFAIDGDRVAMVASASAAHRAEKPWPRGLPEGFAGLPVIDLATGERVTGVVAFGTASVRRLKADADGDFLVDQVTGRGVEEVLKGHFELRE